MSQLSTRDGVKCDLCHIELKEAFQYYSYDLHKSMIFNKRFPSVLKANRSNPIRSLDVCGNCHDKFARRVVAAYKKTKGLAYCELTGNQIDDGPATIVFVTLIQVNLKTKSVLTDTNLLSFLISKDLEKEFEPKQLVSANDAWEVKS